MNLFDVYVDDFLFTALLLLLASILLWILARKRSWTFRIVAQIAILLLWWPLSDVLFYGFFDIGTYDGSARTTAAAPSWLGLPKGCEDVRYHGTPVGQWFACRIDDRRLVKKWLAAQSFRSAGLDANAAADLQCGPFNASDVYVKIAMNKHPGPYEIYRTPLGPNSAGQSAELSKKFLLVCQWYF